MTAAVVGAGAIASVMAATWRRRGGALLPLVLAVIVLSPLALGGWLCAEWSRRWLARPRRVRRTLERLGLAALAEGRVLSARRINKGRMNAVLLVTATRAGEEPRTLVLKHLLRFGTLLGWAARTVGATTEYPRAQGATARTVREARALVRLHRLGFPTPRCLAVSVRERVVAMEHVAGAELAREAARAPDLAGALGQLLARMHAADYSMGDANPENMLVDGQGRIVPLDLEQSHFGAETTWRRRGFDLAWAAAFLASDEQRRSFLDAYGARPAALEEATVAARTHLARFSPIVELYGRRWRGPAARVECLQIEPTTRCNFTCGFCCGRSMTQSDIERPVFERALDDFPDARHLELQGEGEPLMHPRFFEMVAAAHARGMRVSFITNGSHFSPENVDRLLACRGVEKVSVSLESADGATFRAIRGGKLEKVVAGLERLVAERNARGLDRPVVGLSVTLLRRTNGHLSAILDLYRRLGLDGGVSAQPLQRMPAYELAYDAATSGERLTPDEIDLRMLDHLRRAGRLPRRRSARGFYEVLMAGWRPSSRSCPWLDKGLYVNRDGLVTPCCMIKDPSHALGRVGVDRPGEILARRERLRAELRGGAIPAPCRGCEIARYASMGRAEAVGRVVSTALRVVRQP